MTQGCSEMYDMFRTMRDVASGDPQQQFRWAALVHMALKLDEQVPQFIPPSDYPFWIADKEELDQNGFTWEALGENHFMHVDRSFVNCTNKYAKPVNDGKCPTGYTIIYGEQDKKCCFPSDKLHLDLMERVKSWLELLPETNPQRDAYARFLDLTFTSDSKMNQSRLAMLSQHFLLSTQFLLYQHMQRNARLIAKQYLMGTRSMEPWSRIGWSMQMWDHFTVGGGSVEEAVTIDWRRWSWIVIWVYVILWVYHVIWTKSNQGALATLQGYFKQIYPSESDLKWSGQNESLCLLLAQDITQLTYLKLAETSLIRNDLIPVLSEWFDMSDNPNRAIYLDTLWLTGMNEKPLWGTMALMAKELMLQSKAFGYDSSTILKKAIPTWLPIMQDCFRNMIPLVCQHAFQSFPPLQLQNCSQQPL